MYFLKELDHISVTVTDWVEAPYFVHEMAAAQKDVRLISQTNIFFYGKRVSEIVSNGLHENEIKGYLTNYHNYKNVYSERESEMEYYDRSYTEKRIIDTYKILIETIGRNNRIERLLN